MKNFESVKEILDFAIGEEEAAASFYKDLAGKMENKWMKDVFEQFSREEDGHKTKLEKVKNGHIDVLPQQNVMDLKIGDYLIDAEVTTDMDYQQALILAMKKEKVAFRMYSDLASVSKNDEIRDLLLSLAQEEAKHKLRFEVEYDDVILKDN
jgi:rubrerythrin